MPVTMETLRRKKPHIIQVQGQGNVRRLPGFLLGPCCSGVTSSTTGSTWKHRTPTPTPDLQSQALYFTGATLAHKNLIISRSPRGCHPASAGRCPPDTGIRIWSGPSMGILMCCPILRLPRTIIFAHASMVTFVINTNL